GPLTVRAESEEPVFLGESVRPVLFRHLIAGIVLAVPAPHRIELCQSSPVCAMRRVTGIVLHDERLDEVWSLQNNAAARGPCRRFTEVPDETAALHHVE